MAAILFLSDLELDLRGRTFTEPQGEHVVVCRGRDAAGALDHLATRRACRGIAILDPPRDAAERLDLAPLRERSVFVGGREGGAVRTLAQAALKHTDTVEWAADRVEARLREWALPVAGLVLAAGRGTRMGPGGKLLLDLGGRPLVRYAVTAANEGGCHSTWAVYSEPGVARVLEGAANLVCNPDPAAAQADSLRLGLAALPGWAQAAAILLGDQPLVDGRTVRRLIDRWREEDARPAVAAEYHGVGGWRPPVVVGRELWPDLAKLEGDAGARVLFDRHPGLVEAVISGGRPDDVDTPEDYARIVRLPPHR